MSTHLLRKICFRAFASEDFWPCTGRAVRQTVLGMGKLAASVGEPITILSERESWSLLASVALGGPVTSVAGRTEFQVRSRSRPRIQRCRTNGQRSR